MDKQVTVQRIATKAVVVKDGKALVLREADTYEEGTNIGRYGLLGGRLDVGEPFADGLRREVREETGLDFMAPEDKALEAYYRKCEDAGNH